jgi:hypothetical protein
MVPLVRAGLPARSMCASFRISEFGDMSQSTIGSRPNVSDGKPAVDTAPEPPVWGLRSPHRMTVLTLKFLENAGPQTAEAIARYLTRDSPAAAQPNKRRKSGLSSANQVVVTLKNLGLATRAGEQAALTDSGVEFAAKVGTPEEQGGFRDILFANRSFVWFWQRATASGNTTGRRDLLQLAAEVYPNYKLETHKTLVGVYLNYAKNAGLVREGLGGGRYQLSNHRIPLAQSPSLANPKIQSSVTTDPSATGGRAHDPLVEVSSKMGSALADEALLTDTSVRVALKSSFANAARSRAGFPEVTLVKLAEQEADAAFEFQSAELLRRAIRLVTWILANPRRPQDSQAIA